MTARKAVIYGRSCRYLPGLVHSDFTFLDVLKTVFTFADMFELKYGIFVIKAKTGDIGTNLKRSHLLQGAI